MPKRPKEAAPHTWEFPATFDGELGWQPRTAVTAVKAAVSEIKKVARKTPAVGAEGATMLIERLSPALASVDSSSGAIGSAVDGAIEQLASIIAAAPADDATRTGWLDRLAAARAADRVPYLEALGKHWGELCVSPEIASAWVDRLLAPTRDALRIDGYFHGITMCLSALYRAGRFDELHALVDGPKLWDYKRWAVRALVAAGRIDDAVAYAESCRSPHGPDPRVDALCEEILLDAGRAEDAYRYAPRASHAGTYLATFRNVARKYPHKEPRTILADLVATTPGDEGKWFAAAKDAELYDEAIALAGRSAVDTKTLIRAARDHATTHPAFAVEAALSAVHWIAADKVYEPTADDVTEAGQAALAAAEHAGSVASTRDRLRALSAGSSLRFVRDALGAIVG